MSQQGVFVMSLIIFKIHMCGFKTQTITCKGVSSHQGLHQRIPTPWHVWPRTPSSTSNHIISFKGSMTINPSSVGPRTSSKLLHKVRGFMGFFNHLNHTRGPPRVKIHHGITCGVASPSLRVPKGFFIKQEASWASSTTLATQGDLYGSRSIMTLPVGFPGLLLGYHDTNRAWMTTEWVINASPRHLGLLHHLPRLQNHL